MLALTAGCVGESDPPGADDSEDPVTDDGDTTPPDGEGDTTGPGDPGGRLVLDRVQRPTAAVRLNDLGGSPAGEVPTAESLSEHERELVAAAVDGAYRTDGTPDWLTAFLAGRRVVRRDGQYLRLEHTLPRYTVTASEVDPGRYTGRIADSGTYREVVTHDGVVQTGLVRIAADGGYTTVDPWPALLSFLEEYEAVWYRGAVYALSLSVDDPGPPYTVTAERVSPTALADRPVFDATDAPERVREAVRAAGETDGVYASETLPGSLLDAVAEHQYVYLDGVFYFAGLERRGTLPARVEATAVESALPEPRVRLSVDSDADRQVELFIGAPTPFGVLKIAGDGTEHLLWTDAYRESDHVFTEGRRVTGGHDVGLTVPVPAGGRVSETYTVLGDLSPGAYALRTEVGVETGDGGGALPVRVFFRVTR